MRKSAVSILFFFSSLMLPHLSQAQNWHRSAYTESICGAVSCESGSASVGQNPAGTASCGLLFGAGYINRFGIKETSEKSALMAIPLGHGAISACYSHYGFQLYSHSHTSLAYAMPLGGNLSAGISLDHYYLHIDDAPDNSHAVSAGIGILYKIADNWQAGTWISNISNSQYSNSDTILPIRLCAGIRRNFYGGHTASIDVEKTSLEDEIIIRGGLVAHLCDNVNVMVGVSTHPTTLGMGTEILIQNLALQFSAKRDAHLGWIPSATIIWSRKQAKKSEPK